MRGVLTLLVAACGVSFALPAHAQQGGSEASLTGFVADQFGELVVGAEVLVVDVPQPVATRTAAGAYRLEGVPAGTRQVRVRRPGYLPSTATIALRAGDTRVQNWELRRLPPTIEAAAVQGDDGELRAGMQAFQERRQTAAGTFVDRAAIEQRRPRYTRELLRGVSGFRLVASSGSGDVVLWSAAAAGGSCRASLYVEGVPYTPIIGVDDFAPEDIEAMEAYPAGSPVAAELDPAGGCGALVIWLRR